MGWWKMDEKTGGIGCRPPTGKPAGTALLNAFPDRDSAEDHYGGDEPADVMSAAIAEIARVYQRVWGRPPYLEELDGVFTFCMGRHRAAGKCCVPSDP